MHFVHFEMEICIKTWKLLFNFPPQRRRLGINFVISTVHTHTKTIEGELIVFQFTAHTFLLVTFIIICSTLHKVFLLSCYFASCISEISSVFFLDNRVLNLKPNNHIRFSSALHFIDTSFQWLPCQLCKFKGGEMYLRSEAFCRFVCDTLWSFLKPWFMLLKWPETPSSARLYTFTCCLGGSQVCRAD